MHGDCSENDFCLEVYHMDKDVLHQALCGTFLLEESVRNGDAARCKPPKFRLLVFVSSTFIDTERERNIIFEAVAPKLKKEGHLRGGIDVTFVDLRWGVQDQNTLEHRTWADCSRELARCRRDSSGLFLICLQSERYGYTPLPREIEENVLDSRLADNCCSDKMRDLVRQWYKLDLNSIPRSYILKPLVDLVDNDYWDNVLPVLTTVLMDLPFDPANPDLLLGRSVTEWEMRTALSRDEDCIRCIWMHRELTHSSGMPPSPKRKKLRDAELSHQGAANLETLKTWMHGRVGSGVQYRHFRVDEYDLCELTAEGENYLLQWERSVTDDARDALAAIVERHREWEQNGIGIGIPGRALEEMLHHYHWAYMKCADFVGREHTIQQAMEYLESASSMRPTESDAYRGIDLFIVGNSGCGKTALMARLAQRFVELNNSSDNGVFRPVVLRFCGTSAGSAQGLDLVTSLCCQIELLHTGKVDPSTLSLHDYKNSVTHLHALLYEYPVALFIDSLDQLSDADMARSRVSFLRGVIPHKYSRIVVSALPDDPSVLRNKCSRSSASQCSGPIYFYGCDTCLSRAEVPRLVVEKLQRNDSAESVEDITKLMLQTRGRTVTTAQLDKIVSSAMSEPTILYLSLAVRTAAQWHSWSLSSETTLRPTVQGIIEQNFDLIERTYGRKLTRLSLGLITFAKAGLSDQELEDLLSQDDAVLKEVFQYHSSSYRRLPSHVWLRVKAALDGLIVEGEGGRMRWYHRQLRETAVRRYSQCKSEKRLVHRLLAEYFGNIVDKDIIKSRHISEHPLLLDTDMCSSNIWFFSSVSAVNPRRCVEAAHHMMEAEMGEAAVKEMCDLDTICAHFYADVGIDIVPLLSKLLDMVQKDKDLLVLVKHYYRWLQKDASSIAAAKNFPDAIFSSLSQQPLSSLARKALFDRAGVLRNLSSVYNGCGGSTLSPVIRDEPTACYRSLVIGGKSELEFDALVGVLTGHNSAVRSIAWSPDSIHMVSTSFDKQVYVWNTSSRHVSFRNQSHCHGVLSSAWSHDKTMIASGDAASVIHISYAVTGALMRTLRGHSKHVMGLCFHPHDKRLASASDDGYVFIWCLEDGSILKRLMLSSGEGATHVHWNPMGNLLATSCRDGVVRVYASTSHDDVTIVGGSDGPLFTRAVCSCVEFSNDGLRLASCGWDHLVRVYKVASWEEEWCLRGHLSWISSLCWSPNDLLIASASEDRSIIIWNTMIGVKVTVLKGHEGSVLDCAWSPDGNMLASCSNDRTICLWACRKWMPVMSSSACEVTAGDEVSSLQIPVHRLRCVAYHAGALVRGTICPSGKDRLGDVDDAGEGNDDAPLVRIPVCATACDDGCGRVWDARWGHLLCVLQGHEHRVWDISISHSGIKALTASADKTARVWDLASGKCILHLEDHEKGLPSAAWSPCDSKIVTCSWDGRGCIWNAMTGILMHTLTGHTNFISGVSWSSDGVHIATASHDNTVRLWDSSTKTFLSSVPLDDATCVAWSVRGNQLAIGNTKKVVKVWDVISQRISATLSEKHRLGILCVSWNRSDSILASGSWDKTIVLWSVESWKVIRVLCGHSFCVRKLCWGPDDSTLCSCSEDGTVRFWNISKADYSRCIASHPTTPSFFSLNRSLNLLAVPGSSGRDIRIWNIQKGNLLCVMRKHDDIVSCLKWSPGGDQLLLSGDDRGAVILWTQRRTEQDTWQVKYELMGHKRAVVDVVWSELRPWCATCSADCTVYVWNVSNGHGIGHVESNHLDSGWRMQRLQWSPTGDLLVWCISGICMKVIDVSDGVNAFDLEAIPDDVVWRQSTDSLQLLGLINSGRDIASWDFSRLTSAIPVSAARTTSVISLAECDASSLWWHPGGDLFAVVTSGGEVKIVDASMTSPAATLRGHTGAVNCVIWSPDGRNIATASDDTTIRVWCNVQLCKNETFDGESEIRFVELKGHVAAVCMLDWCNNGSNNCLVSIARDGEIRVWDFHSPDVALTHESGAGCIVHVG